MFKIPNSFQVRKTQLQLAAGLLFIVVIIALLFVYLLDGSSTKILPSTSQSPKAVEIESGGKRVNAEEMWRYKMEDDQKKITEELQGVQKLLQEAASPKTTQRPQNEIQALEEKIVALEANLGRQIREEAVKEQGQALPTLDLPPLETLQGEAGRTPHTSLIQKITLNLGKNPKEPKKKDPIKTVDNTIPAGAFAKAVLLGGVDASTAMGSASDPRPVLLRIVDRGNLPRRFKSDLEDCHCIASAYGDLSSERVYLRLEKLTCTERVTGEIVETQVAGYIAGEDGRSGVRGTVVAKDLGYLQNSMIGGVFSGFSKTMSPQSRQSMVNPFSAGNPSIDAPSNSDLFKSGMAEGASTALDRLSKYYIERAEQLQPVIQVAAGRKVDVVFTEGVSIGESEVKKALADVRDKARVKAAQDSAYSQSGVSSIAQENGISTIQQYPLRQIHEQ